MRLTGAGKFLLFVVGLGVLGVRGLDVSRSVAWRNSRHEPEHVLDSGGAVGDAGDSAGS